MAFSHFLNLKYVIPLSFWMISLNALLKLKNINKSIHYLTIFSNQNNSFAQFLLDEIYHLELSSNNNNVLVNPWEIEDIQVNKLMKKSF